MDGERLEYLRGCRLVELEGECRRRLEALRECMAVCWFEPFRVPFGMALKGYLTVMDACGKRSGGDGMLSCLPALDAVQEAERRASEIHALGRRVFCEMVIDLYQALSDYAYMTWQDFSGANTQIAIGCEI